MSTEFTPISDVSGPGEVRANLDLLAGLFPDALVDGRIDFDVLRDLLGEDAELTGSEAFGLRWPGMSEARRLSTLPATGTLLPRPDESVDWDKTKNIVIEGDNLEVLRLLRRGYTNKVDVIYIDPPYNTGNEFVYDDSRMSSFAVYEAGAGQRDDKGATQVGEDSDRMQDRRAGASRHATWLSMMYPRLLVAHHLLKETGVIIAAIDDNEHARLKLLLDRVFGAENFAANVVWQGSGKNDSRFTSGGVDYMLIFAKNKSSLIAADVRWKEPKKGYELVMAAARDAWTQAGGDASRATEILRAWWKKKPDTEAGLTNYSEIDDSGQVFRRDNLASPNPRKNLMYDVLHPVTGVPVAMHPNGWRLSSERMRAMIDEGRILFGKDHTQTASFKRPLAEMADQAIRPVFNQDRANASDAVSSLIGQGVFDFPKDCDVIGRWLDAVTESNPNALVLDFFAGSGSTGHAVMNLNAADGGARRYILVQLNEPTGRSGYATIADITRERLRRAGIGLAGDQTLDSSDIDIDFGFRSYRLSSSNIRPWDGATEQLNLIEAVDNLVEGRSDEDLLVEMMLRLGVELTTPVERREVADSALYSLGGTLYAYFGTEITTKRSNEIAKALVTWRAEDLVDSDVTVVVRDTGFVDSSAKLNLAAALAQAGFTSLRSI